MAIAPRVRIQAAPTGDRLQGPTQNAALQLAEALGDIEPAAREFTDQRGADLRREAAVEARKDALAASGATFADAVRQGLIEPTQNPFYMDAYERESANVSATSQLAALTERSQTWEERNNPQAFQDRLNREIAELGQAYSTDEARVGFLAAVAPAQQQLVAANTARNVQRITKERDDNAGLLVARRVTEVNALYGGNATPEQVFEALAGNREEYLATGGSEAEWQAIVVGGVRTAAYNAGDPDLINVLKDPRSNPTGEGALYELPGVAQDLEQDQYRIRQGYIDRLGFAEQTRRAEAVDEGGRIRSAALEVYGAKLLTGDFDADEFVAWAQGQGYSLAGAAEAIRQISSTVADTQSLQVARQRAFGLNPQNALMLLDLNTKAMRDGYSQGLADEVGDLVLQGVLPMDDARSILGSAMSRTQQIRSEGRQEAREARREAREAQADDPSYIDSYGELHQRFLDSAAAAVTVVETNARTRGLSFTYSDTEQAAAFAAAERAGRTYLQSHPGDFAGAREAATNAAAQWAAQRLARLRPRNAAPAGTTDRNARR